MPKADVRIATETLEEVSLYTTNFSTIILAYILHVHLHISVQHQIHINPMWTFLISKNFPYFIFNTVINEHISLRGFFKVDIIMHLSPHSSFVVNWKKY